MGDGRGEGYESNQGLRSLGWVPCRRLSRKFHGQGTLQFAEGGKFIGTFENGVEKEVRTGIVITTVFSIIIIIIIIVVIMSVIITIIVVIIAESP